MHNLGSTAVAEPRKPPNLFGGFTEATLCWTRKPCASAQEMNAHPLNWRSRHLIQSRWRMYSFSISFMHIDAEMSLVPNISCKRQDLVQQLCQPSVDSCSAMWNQRFHRCWAKLNTKLNTVAEPRKPRRLWRRRLQWGNIMLNQKILCISTRDERTSLELTFKTSALKQMMYV